MAFLSEADFLLLIHDLARLMRTRADQRARMHGMTRAQWVILFRLRLRPGLSQNELAQLVEVEPITIARMIDRLEARGLVERRLDATDRRVRRLHLTPAADGHLSQMEAYTRDLRANLIAGIDPATLAAATEALLHMKNNLLAEKRETARTG